MGRRSGWRSGGAGVGAVLLALACAGDSVNSPASCPAYCATAGTEARDTVLAGVVTRDSTYRGYNFALTAGELQVAGTGGVSEARGIVKFFGFPVRVQGSSTDTTTSVVRVDSIRVNLSVRRRTAGTLQLAVYRLPRGTDTLMTYDTATPFFQDSTKAGEYTVTADTGLFRVVIPPGALPTLEADSFEMALGFAVVSPATSRLQLGSNEGGLGAFVERFMDIDSGTTRIKRMDQRLASLDTYVFRSLPAPPADVLTVGGAPAARVIMRLSLPRRIVDSTTVVRATLLLVPDGPALSAAGDTARVLAHALATDLGAKSPVAIGATDTDRRAGGFVPPASTDTVRVDITEVIRFWRADTLRPRTFVLRTTPEGGSLSEVRFWSSANAARRPLVHLTYVLPFRLQAQ